MAVYQDDIADFITATLPNFQKRKFIDLSQTLQSHVVTSRIYQSANYGVDGGESLTWQIKKNYADNYQDIGVGAIVSADPEDRQVRARVDWAAGKCSAAWLEEVVNFQGKSETEILSILSLEMLSLYQSNINGKERRLWGAPSSSTQDPRVPYGIPFWAQKASLDTAAFGFNGGDPSGFTGGAAEIPVATVPAWKNGNFGYQLVNHTDLFPKMSQAIEKSNFKPPRAYPGVVDSKPQYVIYTTYPVWEAIQKETTFSNDNLGRDVGRYYGDVYFKGVPISWVPALTNSDSSVVDTQHPIYGIDWSVLKMFYKTGWDEKLIGPITPDNQPTVKRLYLWSWWNMRCMDRRQLWVGHTTHFAQ